jgi:hypothetical protein
MTVTFTAHNIRLDDGTLTKPDDQETIEQSDRFRAAQRILRTVFPADKAGLKLADLGCLEGGYSVGFARMGFQVLGIEVRETNIAACEWVKSKTKLENLQFIKDDVWNVARYGPFDAIFCCGLLYHLDRPRQFVELLGTITTRIVILETHFAFGDDREGAPPASRQPLLGRWRRKRDVEAPAVLPSVRKHNLSPVDLNEGLPGRWFAELGDYQQFARREEYRWAAWDNRRSFWIQREFLLKTIQEAGFDLVLEQFDNLGRDIPTAMLSGYYHTDSRGMFVGIKTEQKPL